MKVRLIVLLVLALLTAGFVALHRTLALLVAHRDLIGALVSVGPASDRGAVVASGLALLVVRGGLLFVLPPVIVLVGVGALRRWVAPPSAPGVGRPDE